MGARQEKRKRDKLNKQCTQLTVALGSMIRSISTLVAIAAVKLGVQQ